MAASGDLTDRILLGTGIAIGAVVLGAAAFLLAGSSASQPVEATEEPSSPAKPSPSPEPSPEPDKPKEAKHGAPPARPTAKDLFDATACLEDEHASPEAKWRAAAIVATLSQHVALRKHLVKPEQAPAVRGLVGMLASSEPGDVSAASEALSQLCAEPGLRSAVLQPGVCRSLLRFLSGVTARAIAPPVDPPAGADEDGADAGAAAAVRWTAPAAGGAERPMLAPDAPAKLGPALMSTRDGAASLVVPEAVLFASTAQVQASVRASRERMRAEGHEVEEEAAGGAVGMTHAMAVKRSLTLLVNVSASKEGVEALVAAMAEGRDEGCAVVLPVLASATLADATQLSALRLLSNVTAGMAAGELDAAPGSPEAAAVLEALVPLVRCAASTRGFVGVTKAESLLRIVAVVSSMLSGTLGATKEDPTPLLLAAGQAALAAGAVRALAAVLTECSDRVSRIKKALAQAGPGASLTAKSRVAATAASEAVKGSARVLNLVARTVPGAKEEVQEVVAELEAIAAAAKA